MPNITLTWQPTFVSHGAPYPGAPYIIYLEWRRNDNNSLLPQSSSYVYVVENPEGSPVYAGKAKNARGRFNNRANALHELGLHPVDAVSDHIVRIASVNPGSELAWAEKWLVRYLYCKDQQNTTKILQNINLTQSFQAPPGGLTITNQANRNTTLPVYLQGFPNPVVYNANNWVERGPRCP